MHVKFLSAFRHHSNTAIGRSTLHFELYLTSPRLVLQLRHPVRPAWKYQQQIPHCICYARSGEQSSRNSKSAHGWPDRCIFHVLCCKNGIAESESCFAIDSMYPYSMSRRAHTIPTRLPILETIVSSSTGLHLRL